MFSRSGHLEVMVKVMIRCAVVEIGEVQTMAHIVNLCPNIKLDENIGALHTADDVAVTWLVSLCKR